MSAFAAFHNSTTPVALSLVAGAKGLLVTHPVTSLVAAIFIGLCLVLRSLTVPPKHIAHLPSVPLWKFIWAQVRRYSYDEQSAFFASDIKDSPMHRLFILGNWIVMVNTPALAQKLLSNHRAVNKIEIARKYPYLASSQLFGKNIASLPTGDEWRAHRHASNPPFKRSFDLTIFGNSALELCRLIERDQAESPQSTQTVIHMNEYLQQLTLDMLGKALFGYDFQALSKPGGEMVTRYNTVMRQLFNPLYFAFPWIEKVFPRNKLRHDASQFIDTMMEVVVKKREEMDELRRQGKFDEAETHMDLIQHLLIASEDKVDANGNVIEKALFDSQSLRSSFFVFTLAGHDTTSNALSSAMFMIAQHQDVQDKLREEVDAVLGTDNPDAIPTHEDLKQMPYLFAVIKETTRMYPPAAQIGNRILTEDMEMTPGLVFPKGTQVGISSRNIHLSKDVWGPDALEYRPERFLGDDGTTSSKLVASSWIPFGGGVRQCLGMGMSLLEQKVVIAMMAGVCWP
ncbi:cytochrome P450 [Ramicandelaber brevisporus]|nr:cytochrome P450 [Ramicandelaber brevisporus]